MPGNGVITWIRVGLVGAGADLGLVVDRGSRGHGQGGFDQIAQGAVGRDVDGVGDAAGAVGGAGGVALRFAEPFDIDQFQWRYPLHVGLVGIVGTGVFHSQGEVHPITGEVESVRHFGVQRQVSAGLGDADQQQDGCRGVTATIRTAGVVAQHHLEQGTAAVGAGNEMQAAIGVDGRFASGSEHLRAGWHGIDQRGLELHGLCGIKAIAAADVAGPGRKDHRCAIHQGGYFAGGCGEGGRLVGEPGNKLAVGRDGRGGDMQRSIRLGFKIKHTTTILDGWIGDSIGDIPARVWRGDQFQHRALGHGIGIDFALHFKRAAADRIDAQ